MFVYRVGREIGSLAAALGGLDALVFTGGIGEHSAVIRAKVCHQAAWLGLELDDSANEATATRISTPNSKALCVDCAHRRKSDDCQAHTNVKSLLMEINHDNCIWTL